VRARKSKGAIWVVSEREGKCSVFGWFSSFFFGGGEGEGCVVCTVPETVKIQFEVREDAREGEEVQIGCGGGGVRMRTFCALCT
jgi:hypothetical protein